MESPDSMAGEKEACPECGNVALIPSGQPSIANQKETDSAKEKKQSAEKTAGGVIGIIIFFLACWFLFGGGIEQHVADKQVKQYNIAKKSGNRIDTYVQAGIVAACYLQAEDEDNYKKWKAIARQEGKRAGMPD